MFGSKPKPPMHPASLCASLLATWAFQPERFFRAQNAKDGHGPATNAKALAKRDDTAKVITPFEVASATGCRICYIRMLTRDVYQMTWCLVPPAGDKSSHQTERNSGD